MSNPFVGEIRMFGGNFAPNGWMLCQGQLLPISENDFKSGVAIDSAENLARISATDKKNLRRL